MSIDYRDRITELEKQLFVARSLGKKFFKCLTTYDCPSELDKEWEHPKTCVAACDGIESGCECWKLYFKEQVEKEQP